MSMAQKMLKKQQSFDTVIEMLSKHYKMMNASVVWHHTKQKIISGIIQKITYILALSKTKEIAWHHPEEKWLFAIIQNRTECLASFETEEIV